MSASHLAVDSIAQSTMTKAYQSPVSFISKRAGISSFCNPREKFVVSCPFCSVPTESRRECLWKGFQALLLQCNVNSPPCSAATHKTIESFERLLSYTVFKNRENFLLTNNQSDITRDGVLSIGIEAMRRDFKVLFSTSGALVDIMDYSLMRGDLSGKTDVIGAYDLIIVDDHVFWS